MNYNDCYWYLSNKMGIEKMFNTPHEKFQSGTVVAVCKGKNITVSNMLSAVGYIVNFIKANFDVNIEKYSHALFVMNSINFFLMNLKADVPKKEQLHYAVDVIHEIEDMQAVTPENKKANAEIAFVINQMIDLLVPEDVK